jgi:hypothetical protein
MLIYLLVLMILLLYLLSIHKLINNYPILDYKFPLSYY